MKLARSIDSAQIVLRLTAGLVGGVSVLTLLRIGESTTADQIVVFVVLPLFWAFALLALSYAKPEFRSNAVLLLVSLAISVYGAEVFLQYWSRAPQRFGGGGPVWTPDSRVQLIQRMRLEGTRVYPLMPAQMLKTLELGHEGLQPLSPGVSDALTIMCDELGDPVSYESAGHGFNNPPGVWDVQEVPAVVVGDSFTQGVCVPIGQGFPDVLRQTWSGLINVGVMGAGPLSELALLKEFVAPVRPRLVLWVYYEGNDLVDLASEETDDVLPRYLEPGFSQKLMERQSFVDSLLADHLDGLLERAAVAVPPGTSNSHIEVIVSSARLPTIRRMAGIATPFPRQGSALRSLPRVLEEASRTVETWGGQVVLVYLPGYLRFHSWVGEAYRGRQELLRTTRELGIATIDLVPYFEATHDPKKLWTHPEGHLSGEGYAFVADALRRGLEEVGLAPEP